MLIFSDLEALLLLRASWALAEQGLQSPAPLQREEPCSSELPTEEQWLDPLLLQPYA